jgi:hypothetical protein
MSSNLTYVQMRLTLKPRSSDFFLEGESISGLLGMAIGLISATLA